MTDAALLARLFGAPCAEPVPAASVPAPAASAFDLALSEFRGALTTFDVVDELQDLADTDDYVMTDGEVTAHGFAR